MKYSLNLLKYFININDSAENLANNLTLKSCEIEHIFKRQIPQEVVIWKVTNTFQHPDADKLMVCQLDCWSKWSYQICTGWENVMKDTYVPVAIPGCYLPVIDLKISEREMRGQASNGMICSKEELWIQEDLGNHRIWNLQYINASDNISKNQIADFDDISDSDLWLPLSSKYPRLDNVILDVDNKTLTHRPDLTWYFWLSLELQSIYWLTEETKSTIIFNNAKKYSQNMMKENIFQKLEHWQKSLKSVISNTDKLRSYVLIELNNISVQPSTFFSRVSLTDIDWKAINNWVDFSNIFMNLTSQPVHFFDADKISWNIQVRQASKWEKFTDLFDKEYILDQDDIVIADDNSVLALAWVIGWKDSWISLDTKNIVVEIANFDPVSVRKTALKYGTRSDASMRYEKNINPIFTLQNIEFLMDIMEYFKKDLWAYTLWWINYYISEKVNKSAKNITIDYSKLSQVLRWENNSKAKEISDKVLTWLGFTIQQDATNQDSAILSVPHRRWVWDINIKEDIYEEVARISGYDNIKLIPLIMHTKLTEYPDDIKVTRIIESSLTEQCKYTQIESYPRVDESLLAKLWNKQIQEDGSIANLLSLKNALSPETKNLRDSLLYNLASYVAKNHKFSDSFKLYDIGKIRNETFEPIERNYGVQGLPHFERLSCWAICYEKKISDWHQDMILQTKSHITLIMSQLWLEGKLEYQLTNNSIYHPKKQADIFYNKTKIGTIGQIHPMILNAIKIEQSSQVVFYELDMDILIWRFSKKKTKAIHSFTTNQDQIISRDLCFVIDQNESFDQVISAVKTVKEINNIQIFDLYQWTNLPDWKKSIALSITIHWDGSLQTNQINDIMSKAIENAKKVGWELRS